MPLLQVTDETRLNLASAATVLSSKEEIYFYFPQIPEPEGTPVPHVYYEDRHCGDLDLALWIKSQHPSFQKIRQWIEENTL